MPDGNLLIRLIIAHLLADFVLQSRSMVDQKKWFSLAMLGHIGIVLALTEILSMNVALALSIAVLHWIIDGCKISIGQKHKISDTKLFASDQLLHLLSIIFCWSIISGNIKNIGSAIQGFSLDYKSSLIFLGYLLITTPVGFLIKFATQSLTSIDANNDTDDEQQRGNQNGGKWIGIFERIIILTLVLLGQYEAIGFLITGKGIIRFVGKDDHLHSEYILLGTMMSYAIAILVGVSINWLLSL